MSDNQPSIRSQPTGLATPRTVPARKLAYLLRDKNERGRAGVAAALVAGEVTALTQRAAARVCSVSVYGFARRSITAATATASLNRRLPSPSISRTALSPSGSKPLGRSASEKFGRSDCPADEVTPLRRRAQFAGGAFSFRQTQIRRRTMLEHYNPSSTRSGASADAHNAGGAVRDSLLERPISGH